MSKKIIKAINFIIVFLLFWLIGDMMFSNFYLNEKKRACYDIEKDFYELKKNCTGREKFKSGFKSVKINTDEFGFRYNGNKKELKKKIFFLGDSFTYGLGIEYRHTFVGILENRVKEYQFYNLSVPSYSPTVYFYKLKKLIDSNILPNKIVIVLDLTDVIDEATRWKFKENFLRPQIINEEFLKKNTKLKEFIHKNFQGSRMISSILNNFFRIIRYKNIIKKEKTFKKIKTSIQGNFTYTDKENLNKLWWKNNKFEDGLNKIDNNILKISNLSKKINSELYLVIFPWAETLEFGQDKFNWEQFGTKLCIKYNCQLVNLFPKFLEIKENDLYWLNKIYFINDEHFNISGNKLVADFLFKEIFDE